MNQHFEWKKPRTICVVVDNDSWFLPYAENLVIELKNGGDNAHLARTHDEVPTGDIGFYLGCVHITPIEVLSRMHKNIVVHASDLPKGRGYAPVAWQILEGKNNIPVCLIEMAEEVDAGPIVYKDIMPLEGHELYDEWRDMLGKKLIEMCLRYVNASVTPQGTPQSGEPTLYARRRPKDSRLSTDKTIVEQFDLLRIVDNNNYPAFFEYRGNTYELTIKKVK